MSSRRILELYPDSPVSLRYVDADSSEALATFSSFAAALHALCYDAGIQFVLAMTVYEGDDLPTLSSPEIKLLLDSLRTISSVGTSSDNRERPGES